MKSPAAGSVIRYYDEIAYEYEEKRFGSLAELAASLAEIEALAEIIPKGRGELSLDAGTGTGRLLPLHKRLHYTPVGFDGSRKMLRDAMARHGRTHPLVQGDLFSMPFKNGTFTLVTSLRTVWHFEKPVDLVAELFRVTAPEGIVVFDLANRSSFTAAYRRIRKPEVTMTFTSREEGVRMVESLGGEVLHTVGSRSPMVQAFPTVRSGSSDKLVELERRLCATCLGKRLAALTLYICRR